MINAAISIPIAVAPTATPNPAIPPGNWEPFEVSRRTSTMMRVLMPKQMRCAPIPIIAVVTPGASQTAVAPVRSPAVTERTALARTTSSATGPSERAVNLAAARAAITDPSAAMATAAPDARSPAPIMPMIATAAEAPRAAITEPAVVRTELVATSHDCRTTFGRAADTPAPTKRLTPIAASAQVNNRVSPPPATSSTAVVRMKSPRSTLAHRSTRRRSQRSSRAPAKGPITE